jgi:hypothetical protein
MSDTSTNAAAKTKTPSIEERLAALEQAEARIKEREKEFEAREAALKLQEDSSASRPMRTDEKLLRGDGYRFEVGPIKKDSGLPTKEFVCCDETEAIRVYIMTTQDPVKKGKQVDTVPFPVYAKCLDDRRANNVKQQKMVSIIRAKDEKGHPLTDEERMILEMANERVGV